jgi:hypothetical protein
MRSENDGERCMDRKFGFYGDTIPEFYRKGKKTTLQYII